MSERARRIGRNLVAMSVAQFLSRGFAFITTVHLARTLGVEHFGIVVFALTVLAYAELVVQFGFNRLGSREIARDESSLHLLVQTVVNLRLLLAVAAAVLLVLFSWLSSDSELSRQVTLLYGISLFLVAFDLSWVFMGLETMGIIAIGEVAAQIIMAAAVLVFVNSPGDVIRVPLIYLAAQTANYLVLFMTHRRRNGHLRLGLPAGAWRPFFRASLPLALSSAMAVITFNFDTLLVGVILGTEAAGFYGAAYRIVWLPSLAAAAYFSALFPSIDRAYTHGLADVAVLLSKSIRFTIILALGLGIGGTLLAHQTFDFLFGEAYADSIAPFQILIWSISILFVNRNFRVLLVSFDHQAADLKVIAAAAAVSVALNFVLIPRWELAGAAVVTVATESVILILGYVYTRRRIGHVPIREHLLRPLLAAGLMAIALYLTGEWHLLIRIPVGASVYGIALLLFQAVDFDEIRLVMNALWPRRQLAKSMGE